jgi:hypothetical protein
VPGTILSEVEFSIILHDFRQASIIEREVKSLFVGKQEEVENCCY